MYSIYVIDGNDYAKLDVEDIELSTVFSTSDISDISNRKNAATKTITIKGTKNNNQILGHLFHLNRHANNAIDNKLFFNYAPLRTVDCLVYEDNFLILSGNLFVQEINIDKNQNITFTTNIAGKFIGFVAVLGESMLTDIDFTDLTHHYTEDNFSGSKGPFKSPIFGTVTLGKLEKYNKDSNSFYLDFYSKGHNYLYPFIDYGEKFINDTLNVDYDTVKLQNFRPAIPVIEYLDRIFKNAGYTYEIKGNSTFTNRFKSLIIPYAEEKLSTAGKKEDRAVYTKSTAQLTSYNNAPDIPNRMTYVPVRWDTQANTYLTDWSAQYGQGIPTSNREHNLLIAKRTFTSDARIKVSGTVTGHNTGSEIYSVQLVKRDFTTSTLLNPGDFTVIAEQKFPVNDGQIIEFFADFIAPETTYKETDQIQVRIASGLFGTGPSYYGSIFNIGTSSLEFSKDENTSFKVDIQLGDVITPTPPTGIKQFDFVKSLINMFNLYVYNTLDKPKHFIFQTYDEYYALSNTTNIKNTALDWSSKIDYNSGTKIKSILSIPKTYTFTYKDDGNDFINKNYKDKYNENYSTLTFNDSLGLSTERKIEVIFSASPQVSFSSTGRVYPMLVQGGTSIAAKKPVKTNIRILYYNGTFSSKPYKVSKDVFNSSTNTWSNEEIYTTEWYANVSMYWFDDNGNNLGTPFESDGITPKSPKPISSLNFGNPKETYFLSNNSYTNIPNLYNSFYINQTSELTNINLFTCEVGVRLNAVDITNLDLKVPVFINMGQMGNAYFKILNLEYRESEAITTVTLQKINF